jgi:hypothetical protein
LRNIGKTFGGGFRAVILGATKRGVRAERPKVNGQQATENRSESQMKIFSTFFGIASNYRQICRSSVAK